MEGCAALHFDRRSCVMCENKHRSVKRRVRSPGPLPIEIGLPSRMCELSRAHDFDTNVRIVLSNEGIVNTARATVLFPPVGVEHPRVQAIAGVPEVECFG